MNTRGQLVVLCFSVLLQVTMAVSGFELELILSKMDFMQFRLQEVEQSMKATMEKVDSKLETRMNTLEQSLQKSMDEKLQAVEETIIARMEQAVSSLKEGLEDKIAKLEKDGMERNTKLEARMRAMENSLKERVKITENNTLNKLEDLKYQLIPKIEDIQHKQNARSKINQERSQTELMQIGENKKTLEMLTDSVRNISTYSEKSKKILEAHFKYPVRSCRHVMTSGRHIIHVGQYLQPLEVLCEQNKFDGGWTVIQHRFDGAVDFYRNWTEYRNGFGNVNGEFWLGLEYVHQLTKNSEHELLVEIKDLHGNYGYAKYNAFGIGSETERYVLTRLGTYSGTAGDSMRDNKDEEFSTFDRDNDQSTRNCAVKHHGAWWYWGCSESNLNGHYQNTTSNQWVMVWYDFKNDFRALSYSRMMIRDIIN